MRDTDRAVKETIWEEDSDPLTCTDFRIPEVQT
jgi:hypothetical protein